jgi:hypothetical protein
MCPVPAAPKSWVLSHPPSQDKKGNAVPAKPLAAESKLKVKSGLPRREFLCAQLHDQYGNTVSPPPSRTNWTRLVPPPVLTGHASWPSLRPPFLCSQLEDVLHGFSLETSRSFS